MSNPFDESDDDEESNQNVQEIKINKTFADKFEHQERRKDLVKAKDLLDDEDDSEDDESEDDDGEFLSASMDIEIVKVINKIRKKDPTIYDKTTTWFKRTEEEEDDEDDDDNTAKTDKKKRYKDILREQLLKHGADIEHGDNGIDDGADNRKDYVGRSTGALAYDEEQQKIRRAFLQSVGDDGSEQEEGDMMQAKARDPAQIAQEEEELRKALSEMRELGVAEAEEETEKRDSFLLDYISKQQWKSKQQYITREKIEDSSDDDYEEDEEELDKIDLFEHKYNFRFEELQGENGEGERPARNVIGMGLQSLQVTGHARNVEGSVRRVDEKRKKERETRKENKEKEKRQREAELRRLKNLKKQELQERLRQICEVSGLTEEALGLNEAALDEEWDPVKYEAMMQAQFGDDYYGEEDGEGLSLPEHVEEVVDDKADMELEGQEDYDENENEGEEEEYDDGSAAYANGTATSQAKAVSGMLDELYKLDYEDIVAGIPCRFKYRQVEKEDFGLSADEILLAEDAELNKFVSLKRISAYSEPYGAGEQAHKVTKKRKRLRVAIKERLEKEAAEAAARGMEVKGLKNKKTSESEKEEGKEVEEAVVAGDDEGKEEGTSKKRRRRKLKEERGILPPTASLSKGPSLSKEAADVSLSGSAIKETVKKIKEIVNEAKASDISLSSKDVKDVTASSSSSKKDKKIEKNISGKDNGVEISRKKKKTAMAPAPTAHKGTSSKPKTMDENKKRRANLYK